MAMVAARSSSCQFPPSGLARAREAPIGPRSRPVAARSLPGAHLVDLRRLSFYRAMP